MAERCDLRGCPAEALVYVKHGFLLLAFCGSHFDTKMVELFEAGWEVSVDNRPALRLAEERRQ